MFKNILFTFLSKGATSPEHGHYLLVQRLRSIAVMLCQLVILITFFAIWEIAATIGWIDSFITSQPSKVLQYLIEMINNGSILIHIGTTVGETIFGFLSGTIIGIVVAVILWWSDFISKVLDPYIVILNSTPKIALGPIFIVWLGNGIVSIIVMALAISVITTIMIMYTGFMEVDKNKIKLLKTFGATKWQTLNKVILPASIPTMVSALKVNVGLTLVGVIVGEFLVSKAGLGHLIIYGSQVFNLTQVMTSILILCAVAALLYQIVNLLEKKYLQRHNFKG